MGTYKRLPREKAKPKEGLATTLDHAYHWLELNWRAVLAGIGSVAVVVVIILGIASYAGGKDEKARDMLYQAGLITAAGDEAIKAFENVIFSYPSSGAASIARLKLGDIWYEKGDFGKAIEVMAPIQKSSDPAIRILALHNLAAATLASGKEKEAAEYYLKAYNDPKNLVKGLSYFNAGLAFEASGNTDEAGKIFTELSKEETAFSTPPLREKSKEKLLWLAIHK